MNRLFLLSGLILVAGQALCTEPATGRESTPDPGEFILVRQEHNIRVFCRWIPVDETRSARQLKAEFTVDQPPEKVLARIRDDGHFTDWMKNTKAYYRVRSVNSQNWYSYIQFSVPWPLSNQDCILHYEVIPGNGQQEMRILVTGEPGFLREFDGVKRISHMEGEWILKECSPGRTHVEYLLFSRQPSRYPRRITDPIIQNNMLETMNAFCHSLGHE